MSTVGGRIKYYRKLNNLRQKDIYEKIGIEPNLVYDDYMAFIASDYSKAIKMFRKNKLTHKQFGKLMGMHSKISSRWERKMSEPSKNSYEKLKEIFKKYGEEI